MKRRDFITLLGGAAAWPVAARAQQPVMPVIGFLNAGVPEPGGNLVEFRKGLADTGYVEGRNLAIEYRWAHNDNAKLPELADDLVRRQVALIAIPGAATAATRAAKAATASIPIVFGTVYDPVQTGLVANLNRPGGNVTGVAYMGGELAAKQLSLLHQLLPDATRFAALVYPDPALTAPVVAALQTAASSIDREITIITAGNNKEIDSAFAGLAGKQAQGLLISPHILFGNRLVQIVTQSTRHAVPTIYWSRSFPDLGGLMSYGASSADQYRQVGLYAGRILKGERPGDLPILRATKFELVINLETARAFDLTVPPSLLAIADEVIE